MAAEGDGRRRAIMVGVVLVLAVLIAVTPSLVGRQEPITSIPVLSVMLTQDEATLHITSGLADYFYASVALVVEGREPPGFVLRLNRTNTFGEQLKVPWTLSRELAVSVEVRDRQGGVFEYDAVFVVVTDDPSGLYLRVLDLDRGTWRDVRDFPWSVTIPRRATP
jgi:hypothetical protein